MPQAPRSVAASSQPTTSRPSIATRASWSEIARRSWVCHSGFTGGGRIEARKLSPSAGATTSEPFGTSAESVRLWRASDSAVSTPNFVPRICG